MSNLYSSGIINIPNVTGNIVITATATAAAVTSISAVYTQSGTVYDTDSLDSLKSDLVVTASYEGGTTGTVASTDYTLSGTLAVGTDTITVSYAGKTDTFTVTVTKWTNGIVNGSYSPSNGGVTISANNNYLKFTEANYSYRNTNLLLKQPIQLHADDVLTFTVTNSNPSGNTTLVPITMGNSNAIVGWGAGVKPYQSSSNTSSKTVSTDIEADAIILQSVAAVAINEEFLLSLSINNEVIF